MNTIDLHQYADHTEAALAIVRDYVNEHLDKYDPPANYQIYVVWSCHVLGHKKWLISTTLSDGMYYEVTWDSAKGQFYFDAYKKFENRCIVDGGDEQQS